MPVDMKKMIAEAVRTLLIEKSVKKLTVKDIVEECHITRQSFYYHFEDIPSLLHWMLEQGTEQMMREARDQREAEEALRYFFLMSINALPYIRRTMQSNYGGEIERLLEQEVRRMFEMTVEKGSLYQNCNRFELNLIVRYHSQAVIGILKEWTDEDTRNLDQIVHGVYLLMTGSISPFSDR